MSLAFPPAPPTDESIPLLRLRAGAVFDQLSIYTCHLK